MKTIGLLGGTGWSSTIGYYRLLNELTHERLGGWHSAKILLKSIDYHEIMMSYGKHHDEIARLLKCELTDLLHLSPDCVMICCNSLHKYYDMIKDEVDPKIPVLHAIDLVAKHMKEKGYHTALLLATKFTLEDGFFARKLEKAGVAVTIPEPKEREELQHIHEQLMQNNVTKEARDYFRDLITRYGSCDAVILGCTEFPLAVTQDNSTLPLIDPMYLQAVEAVNFALE